MKADSGYRSVATAFLHQGAATGLQLVSCRTGDALLLSNTAQAPKQVITQTLENTDKQSMLRQLKSEIKKEISLNQYTGEE